MAAKRLLFHEEAREKIRRGVATLAEAVKVTLGPRGRTVVLEREFGPPQIVNPGVVVAKSIELEDRFENMGAQLLREVAARTSEMAGGGTTTATVLAHALVQEGLRYLAAGMNPMELKQGIEQAIAAVVAELKTMAQPCTSSQEIAHVAALHATRAAVEEGIVPGGGVALLRARKVLLGMHLPTLDEDSGLKIVARALEEPLRRIVANAAQEPSIVLDRVEASTERNHGYNAARREYGDMMEMGVIDPAKVTRLALQNAGSIASLILTVDCLIAEAPKKEAAGRPGLEAGADMY